MKQQGDVLIKKLNKLPKGVKQLKSNNGSLILAEGEATGHAHRIKDSGAKLYELNGVMYLEVEKDNVSLTHEEHDTQSIEKGIYEIGIVKEYDYFQEMERNVAD